MQPMNYCNSCGAKLTEGVKYCPNCGAAIQPPPVAVPAAPITPTKQDPPKKIQHTEDRPMKWFMFLVYFLLIVGPLFRVISGVRAMSGNAYANADQIYLAFPMLRDLDILMGILSIVEAAALLFVRHWMVKGLKIGVKWYLIICIASTSATLLYTLIGSAIIKTLVTQNLFTVGFNIIYIILNKIYFDKRAEMFSN